MFKDGKIFGKINIFDALIIILVIILVIAGTLKFRTFNKAVDGDSSGKIIYTFAISDVRDYTLNAFKSGDSVFDSTTDVCIGKIINIESEDAKEIKALSNGKSIVTNNPYKKDVLLTIETPGSSTNNAYYANKSIELKIGSEKKVETLYTVSYGKVKSIKYFE